MRRTGYTRYIKATGTVAAPRNYFSSLFDSAGRYIELAGQTLAVMPTGFALNPFKLMALDGTAYDCWTDAADGNVLIVRRLGEAIARLDAETLEPIFVLNAAPPSPGADQTRAALPRSVRAARELLRQHNLIEAGRNAELCGVRDWRLHSKGVQLRGIECALLRDGLTPQERAELEAALIGARAEYMRRVLHLISKGEIAAPVEVQV
jgi:hypothetical protein